MKVDSIKKDLENASFVLKDNNKYYNEVLCATVIVPDSDDKEIECTIENNDVYSTERINVCNYTSILDLMNYTTKC